MHKMLPVALAATLFLQGCAVGIIAAGAGVTADTATDNRSLGNQIDDQTLDIRVTHALGLNKKLWEASNLSAVVQEGQVLVIGQTPTPEMRQEVTDIVKNVNGVKKVLNEVRLGQPVSLSTRARDTWITTEIKTEIYADKHILPGKIKVITENSEVFLIGLVTSKESKNAIEIARNVDGVSRVIEFFKIIPDTQAQS
ncbi:division/outer membrane stress-associated lipid-binding lipoprotein [Celerinatantimonas yamalensis]|uniref:Division/outer membrane stress-associated lipid-binding lipoprotein n=1 Tax=Celerinatantimonas yamalensis TaxID=559956 RepID=A0ABW9GBJ7_9GAMM